MADLAALEQQRKQVLAEIQRRGGKDKAPGFAKQLQQLDVQIKQMRAQGGQPQSPSMAPPLLPQNTPLKTAPDIVNAQGDVSTQIAEQNDRLNNANQVGATGDTRTYTKDENGRTVITDRLSDPNQRILQAGQNLSGETLDRAFSNLSGSGLGTAFNPQTAQRTLGNNWSADRQGVTDAVFANLTRGVDQEYQRTMDAKAQELANRGIPLGSKAYNNQMEQLNRRYDDLKTNARNQAIQSSGDEFTRQFGQQEQLIANQISQGAGIRNQNLSETERLAQVGPGMVTSQFQGQTPVSIDTPDVAGITMALREAGLNERQINAAIANMKRSSGGGRPSGPSQPAFSSPFNTSGPPI